MLMRQFPAVLATRLAFWVAGFAIACWAPLVPLIKIQFSLDEGVLGLLLLCLGSGSIVAMALTGVIAARWGNRSIIFSSGLALAVLFPLLSLANSPLILSILLFLFGACMGVLEVAMNVHAVEVEKSVRRTLMSGFHGMFSVGGFIGAGFMTFLLSIGMNMLLASLICSILIAVCILITKPRLQTLHHDQHGPTFMLPSGIVIVLAVLAGIIFMAEGAMLDWGALLMIEKGGITPQQGGLAYMLFASAMTIGRFGGDAITTRLGDFNVMLWGGLLALLGFVLIIVTTDNQLSLLGFFFIGLGSSNLVPVLFRRAGSQTVMPSSLAVAAISTVGYGGILLGPALIGFVADVSSLLLSFTMLAVIWLAVPLLAKKVSPAS